MSVCLLSACLKSFIGLTAWSYGSDIPFPLLYICLCISFYCCLSANCPLPVCPTLDCLSYLSSVVCLPAFFAACLSTVYISSVGLSVICSLLSVYTLSLVCMQTICYFLSACQPSLLIVCFLSATCYLSTVFRFFVWSLFACSLCCLSCCLLTICSLLYACLLSVYTLSPVCLLFVLSVCFLFCNRSTLCCLSFCCLSTSFSFCLSISWMLAICLLSVLLL